MDAEGPKATLEAMKDVMRFWLGMGCDGFRVDMAGSLVKNDEDGKGTIKLWQNVREFLDREFPEAAMVSEWGEPDKSIQGGFHMDFLLHFGPSHYNDLFRCEEPFFSDRGKGDVSEFVSKYKENYEKSEKKGLICIPSGNHDMDRLARTIKGDNLKIAFAFLLSMPGAPFIYYGDEIGMRYVVKMKHYIFSYPVQPYTYPQNDFCCLLLKHRLFYIHLMYHEKRPVKPYIKPQLLQYRIQ